MPSLPVEGGYSNEQFVNVVSFFNCNLFLRDQFAGDHLMM